LHSQGKRERGRERKKEREINEEVRKENDARHEEGNYAFW
jgi:hypothetical protein